MSPLLPPRCTATAECAGKRHWTKQSKEECLSRQQRPPQNKPATITRVGLSWEEDRETAEMREAVAGHDPEAPAPGSTKEALLEAGKKQLLLLSSAGMQAVDLLLTTEIYTINGRLRDGRSLAGLTTSVAGDWAGVGYKHQIVDAADNAFASLGPALKLGSPATMFRRIGVPEAPDSDYPDIAGIHAHMKLGIPLPPVFTDPGYLFAVTDPDTAMMYGDNNHTSPHIPKFPVLVELEVDRALCIPDYMHRSKELFEFCYPWRYLRGSTGQVIIPRDSKWEILDFQAESRYSGVPVLKLRQL